MLCLWILTAVAPVDRYAIIIGANSGGPSQERLRYAEADAAKIAAVLMELGQVPPGQTQLLAQPTPAEVLTALDHLEQVLAARKSGAPAMVIFYYSGHAKATALSLGGDELSLSVLRERLERLRTDVRLVLLDACQSGAYSRAKGASRVADFSFNSVEGLTVAGSAVLSSSSASELSQEADDAAGSYFTHHLVAALRGAADTDNDGRVTLDEAYRYTHARTLEDTIKTSVGSQHVTFENALSGQGALALTQMPRIRRRVVLAESLSGRVLFARADSGAIVADVRKVKGERFSVTLPVGSYRAGVRSDERAYACQLQVMEGEDTELETTKCKRLADTAHTSKRAPRMRTRFALELGIGGAQQVSDAYNQRLRDFSYSQDGASASRLHLQAAIVWNTPVSFLGLYVEAMMLDVAAFNRFSRLDNTEVNTSYDWKAFGLAAGIRATWWLVDDWVNPYAQLSVGPGIALARFSNTVSGSTAETFVGPLVHPALGINFLFHPRVGLYLQFDYYFAPLLRTLMNDVHQSGGFGGTTGLRLGL